MDDTLGVSFQTCICKFFYKYIFFFSNQLEADDNVVHSIRAKYPYAHIYIITNDQDYLQLCEENTKT